MDENTKLPMERIINKEFGGERPLFVGTGIRAAAKNWRKVLPRPCLKLTA